ncbi:MAG: UvrD-helicase domain-containing protein [Gammaproteobacteria bacterium]|nr:UvrD-helicase domain-containing protein [Gammaproteobacteria bacterium]MDE0247448.1 UvrD-helicase domain-containing protein [Gammaproteobacteria bacterium]
MPDEPPPPRGTAHSLNPEQRFAVEHVRGPLLVLAGAGSGKTRVLTMRVAHLIKMHGVLPDRILAATFTNKAAGEMRERIRTLLGHDPFGVWIGTFHSIGARILRRHAEQFGRSSRFTILDADDNLREVKRVMKARDVDTKLCGPNAVRRVMSDAKNRLISPSGFRQAHRGRFDLVHRTVIDIYPAYQRSLQRQDAFDFDDLLMKPVELFERDPDTLGLYQRRFEFLLVDEYQDTNRAQFRFLELVAAAHRNLMVVGDDDQSIYGWRGADIRNILDFEKTYPETRVVRLEENYRSTPTILGAANAAIRLNRDRKEKTLRTRRPDGWPIDIREFRTEAGEAGWVAQRVAELIGSRKVHHYRDIAVLYRTNAQSRVLEDALRDLSIPYHIAGGLRFYERREIKDVLAYLRLLSNPRDDSAFRRAVNYPRRGVGARTLEWLGRQAEEENLGLLEAAVRAGPAGRISASGARGLRRFTALIARYSERACEVGVGVLIRELVGELDLLALLRSDGPEGMDRANNVNELVSGATQFDARDRDGGDEREGLTADHLTELDLFLQQAALFSELDRHDPDADLVTLMTVHNAKGLEFPCVFMTGLEDGLFPLSRSLDDRDSLEEERRLFYVGITRAEHRLSLSWAGSRMRAGRRMVGRCSRFVRAIPARLTRGDSIPVPGRRHSGWGSGGRRRGSSGWPARRGGRAGDTRQRDRAAPVGEEEMNQDLAPLRKGERVLHRTFGSGTVLGVSGYGRDVRVLVDFDSVGQRKLVARIARLERDVS